MLLISGIGKIAKVCSHATGLFIFGVFLYKGMLKEKSLNKIELVGTLDVF